jgi:hypothetical protein
VTNIDLVSVFCRQIPNSPAPYAEEAVTYATKQGKFCLVCSMPSPEVLGFAKEIILEVDKHEDICLPEDKGRWYLWDEETVV